MPDHSSCNIPEPHPAMDGLYASFYPVESVLLSQLQSFYNASVMYQLGKLSCSSNPQYNITTLSQSSRFPVNVTFITLIEQLFIESWGETFNYSLYYEQCKPESCSYEVREKRDLFSAISIVISLFGGLSVLFRFVTPLIVTFVLTRCHRQAQQEEPSEDIQPTGKKDSKNILAINQSRC
ncbi:unnamed protein product [Adineta steineri]|uniref:Uncharacterized protein n=1 Tax=Adineta steineri TaxID=433720 RepID=A0A814LTT1_9BILA|nr:unnamed protein product [Adineta steineri]